MNWRKLLLRDLFFVFWVQLLVLGNSHTFVEAKTTSKPGNVVQITKTISKKDILSKSQLTYRAYGGFTEINSYAVLISCVNGKISTYRAIRNNRHGTFRRTGTLSKQAYLNLWDEMLRRRIFTIKNAPAPQRDILDEFTTEFEAKVGDASNKFIVTGCSRPEACQYFALRNLMDQATNMKEVWDLHQSIVRK